MPSSCSRLSFRSSALVKEKRKMLQRARYFCTSQGVRLRNGVAWRPLFWGRKTDVDFVGEARACWRRAQSVPATPTPRVRGRTERIATRCAVFGGVFRSMFSGPLPVAQEEQIWACGAPARRCARLPQVNRAKLRGAKVSDAELSSS